MYVIMALLRTVLTAHDGSVCHTRAHVAMSSRVKEQLSHVIHRQAVGTQ